MTHILWPDTPRTYPATAPRCPVCGERVHRHHVLDGDAVVLKCDGKLRRPGRPRCPAHLFIVGEGATCRVSALTPCEYNELRSRFAVLTAKAVVMYLSGPRRGN